MKRKLLSCGAFLCAVMAWGQEDVTSTYLKNADFEGTYSVQSNPSSDRAIYEPDGWTVSLTNMNVNDMSILKSSDLSSSTFSGFTVNDGTTRGEQTYWFRFRWGSSQVLKVSQTIANLPEGVYRLTADVLNFCTDYNYTVMIYAGEQAQTRASVSTTKGDTWNTLTCDFYVENDGDIEIGLSATNPTAVERIFAVDNFKLYRLDSEEPTDDYPVSMTGCIVNPCFDVNTDGWTYTTGAPNHGRATNQSGDITGGFFENWASNAYSGTIEQTLSGLPNGKYTLKLAAFRQGGTGNAYVFANDDMTLITSDDGVYYEVSTTITDGTLKIGLKSVDGGCNWAGIDNASLIYRGADVSELAEQYRKMQEEATSNYLNNELYASAGGVERTDLAEKAVAVVSKETAKAYNTAIAELQAAVDAFVANYEISEVFKREIAKAKALGMDVTEAESLYTSDQRTTAITTAAIPALKVKEYEYVTGEYAYGVELGAWTTEGPTGSLSSQHWSGETRNYLEQSSEAWYWGSWSIKYAQDLTLPAGKYVFKVAGRKAAGDGCTLTLTVTNNDEGTVLGSVDDFPEGDTGLGINKNGVTSFSPTDAAGFANNNAGRGWEWRYVQFTLTEETSVNIAVNADATAIHQWVGFCDATVQTTDEATLAMIAYNIALRDAKATIADETYASVTGSERTELQTEIDTAPGTTTEEIEAATESLKDAMTVFVGSLSSYNDLLAAKKEAAALSELPYASKAKYEAMSSAVDVTPESAGDAVEKAAAIRQTYRIYIESNALAEAVETAVDMTNAVVNPLFEITAEDGTVNGSWDGWTAHVDGGTNSVPSSESFTDGNGKSDYHYYDYLNNDNNVQHLSQTISGLEAGRYLLTVTARGATSLNGLLLEVNEESVAIPCIGNTGGQFGRGWNDVSIEFEHDNSASDVVIGVRATQGSSSHKGWFSFTRVRLVRLTDKVSVDVKINPGKYATRIFPFAPDFGEADVTVYSCEAVAGTTLTLNEVTVPEANMPYILYSETGCETTVSGYNDAIGTENTAGCLTGVLSSEGKEITSGYVLQTLDGVQAFYAVSADDPITVPQYRVYLTLPDGTTANVNALRLVLPGDDDATAISEVAAESATVDVYSISGVLVRKGVKASEALNGLQKGIYVVNGVKKAVK